MSTRIAAPPSAGVRALSPLRSWGFLALALLTAAVSFGIVFAIARSADDSASSRSIARPAVRAAPAPPTPAPAKLRRAAPLPALHEPARRRQRPAQTDLGSQRRQSATGNGTAVPQPRTETPAPSPAPTPAPRTRPTPAPPAKPPTSPDFVDPG